MAELPLFVCDFCNFSMCVTNCTNSDYELGNLNVPVNILDKFADFYGTSIDYLVGRTDMKEAYPKSEE